MNEAKKEAVKNNVDGLSMEDLVLLEKMTRLVCAKYENITKRYDGSIDTSQPKYAAFKKYNDIHNVIIEKMELLINKAFSND